ncbi:XRE family transcriptional regulator [Geomonas sp. Red32]|uniref:LexA family protein n=1 Tax=Geomonas sp. Red32 TaxID=2912856 RepID=UPI00202CF9E9|nr:XRE family transcriptional regulator [Geomonas sp. Red32]MCM0081318.1 XRE family transcriptional regulator [Geomonas sp. Red32]
MVEYKAETGERIRKARQALGLTQKQFAASLGIVQGFLSGIETGRKRPSDTLLIALSHTHGINSDWLMEGLGEPFKSPVPPKASSTTHAPLLEVIPEQFPQAKGNVKGYVSVPDLPEGCYAIVCYGDFMAPTIRDGDIVIFKPDAETKSGDIILVNNLWGEPILRRYRLRNEEVYLAPDNPAYAPFRPDKGTRTFGTVVEVWRKVRI